MACKLCEVFCTVQNSRTKDIIKAFKMEKPRPVSRIVVEEDGAFSFGFQCRHCKEPDCVYACITGAMHLDGDGIVRVDPERCIGCWTCVLACPFGAVVRDLNAGVSAKCDLCPGRSVPACVAGCPNEALELRKDDAVA